MKGSVLITIGCLLGSALMAGLFFAFSVCIMKALAQLPASEGAAAMKTINVAILNPIFLIVFVGTAVASLIGVIFSLTHWQTPGAAYLLAGGLCYLIGTFLVTIIFSVPMNDALQAAAPGAEETARLWATYLSSWTAWNHVRTIGALAATTCFALALRSPI